MCAKREPRDVYQPVADLHEEFNRYAAQTDSANVLPQLSWIGTRAFFGLLENL